MNSIFGWLLPGPVNSFGNATHIVIITDRVNGVSRDNQDDLLSRTLKWFWDSEAIGIHNSLANEQSNTFLSEISLDGTRYEVRLPWRQKHPDIPHHFYLCKERLKYLH